MDARENNVSLIIRLIENGDSKQLETALGKWPDLVDARSADGKYIPLTRKSKVVRLVHWPVRTGLGVCNLWNSPSRLRCLFSCLVFALSFCVHF